MFARASSSTMFKATDAPMPRLPPTPPPGWFGAALTVDTPLAVAVILTSLAVRVTAAVAVTSARVFTLAIFSASETAMLTPVPDAPDLAVAPRVLRIVGADRRHAGFDGEVTGNDRSGHCGDVVDVGQIDCDGHPDRGASTVGCSTIGIGRSVGVRRRVDRHEATRGHGHSGDDRSGSMWCWPRSRQWQLRQ